MRWRLVLGVMLACAVWRLEVATAQYQLLGEVTVVTNQQNGVLLQCGDESVRIGFLTPAVVRVTMARHGQWDDGPQYAIAKTDWPGADFTLAESADRIVLKTTALEVRISRKPCRLAFFDADGNLLNKDDDAFGMARDGKEVAVFKQLLDGELFFGLGEKVGSLDRRGREVEMWNSDIPAYTDRTDPLYQSHPFFVAIRDGHAYGIFFNNTYRSRFNMGAGNHRLYSFRAEDGPLDYFFFVGPGPKDVISRYAELVGKMPLPPLWALGYQQCRWSYYPESEVRRLAETFRAKKIPADVIYLDIHYMDGYRCFTFDKNRFPNPGKMLADLRSQGFKIVTIVDPGIKVDPGYWVYDQGLAGDHFIKYPDGEPYIGDVWPGRSHFTNYTRPESRQWWGDLLGGFVDLGIAGIWNDMNEPAVWGREAPLLVEFDENGKKVNLKKIHNIFGHLMAQSTYEGLRRHRPDERPFILTRAGFSGTQRYAASWTGDNVASFEHLEIAIRLCQSLGLSGVPFVGADVGGFVDSPSPELMARWIQVGAFTPFFRTHSVANSLDQEPWSFGEEVEDINRKYIELRYRLLPYTYTAFQQAAETGLPIMRPLLLEFPADPESFGWDNHTSYLWGEDLLVAPVTRAGERVHKVYLPAGLWYDFWENKTYTGGRYYYVETPLDKLPLFVRAGAVVCLRDVQQYVDEKPQQELALHVYPGAAKVSTLYEDDGNSFAYEKGGSCKTFFTVAQKGKRWSLAISARTGKYVPVARDYRIVLHNQSQVPVDLQLDGKKVAAQNVHFDAAAGTVQISMRDDNKAHELVWSL